MALKFVVAHSDPQDGGKFSIRRDSRLRLNKGKVNFWRFLGVGPTCGHFNYVFHLGPCPAHPKRLKRGLSGSQEHTGPIVRDLQQVFALVTDLKGSRKGAEDLEKPNKSLISDSSENFFKRCSLVVLKGRRSWGLFLSKGISTFVFQRDLVISFCRTPKNTRLKKKKICVR